MDDRALLQARVNSLEIALYKLTRDNLWNMITSDYIRLEIGKLLSYEPSDLFDRIVPRGEDLWHIEVSIEGDTHD